MRVAPLLAAMRLRQLVSTLPPSGVTSPSPVTTTRRIENSRSVRADEQLYPLFNPCFSTAFAKNQQPGFRAMLEMQNGSPALDGEPCICKRLGPPAGGVAE